MACCISLASAHDALAQSTTRVSITSGEGEANGASVNPAISEDGRFVAFSSSASNLFGTDTNGAVDIYIRDRENGTTRRVSLTDSEGQANDHSSDAAISGDGRFVAFVSNASNLIAGDTNGRSDIFVRDRANGTTRRVSLTDSEGQANGHSFGPAISADGQFVAFVSRATNLIGGDTNLAVDIYIRDLGDRTTRRVSVTDGELQANHNSFSPAISALGRFVAFNSLASNLIATDTNGEQDVYIRDRTNGTTRRVSVTDGELEANDSSFGFAMSDDAQFVAFVSRATNLIGSDTNGADDVYIRDRANATTRRVSVTDSELQANGASRSLAISGDGRFVAFEAAATNLVSGDTNQSFDIFVRDRGGFGRRTRVTLALAASRIPARGPLKVRVRNRNGFPVRVALSAKSRPVSVGERRRRVKLKTRRFSVAGRSRKTVKMRLPRVLRRVLGRRGKLSLRPTAKVTGPAGRTRTVRKTVTPRLKR